MRLTFTTCVLAAGASGFGLALALVTLSPAFASPTSEEILYQSNELKIYRSTSPRGTPIVVLTNLDAEGNRLAPPGGAGEDARGAQWPTSAPEAPGKSAAETGGADHAPEGSTAPSSGSVKVVVNQGGGAAAVDERNVEVTTDGSAGTTVIININPPASPERETAIVPASLPYPVFAIGGLAGGYRYPDHLPFLGYGLGTSSPSWFGGLGLNAGNGFGLSNGTPCTHGFDCMFGPPSRPH